MTKGSENASSDGQDFEKYEALKFQCLAKGDVVQDCVLDFVASQWDEGFIALLGSKMDVVTLEMTSQAQPLNPFPYTPSFIELSASEPRPLDALAEKVDLEKIYTDCQILDAQELALETVYTAVCSSTIPPVVLKAVKKAPHLLPNGNYLLAVLNSHGALTLLTKSLECTLWCRFESLNVPITLRDKLLPRFEADKIKNFSQYKAMMDQAWITIFAWLGEESKDVENHALVLGTANGSLWILKLSPDGQTLQDHIHQDTTLDRICFLHTFENLLLVGDVMGRVHLYRFTEGPNHGLTLVKALWQRTDRMGLQVGTITRSLEGNCYYITCCKAAHLLTWFIQGEDCLEARLHVGGIKITALCSLDYRSYAVGTASQELKLIQVIHQGSQSHFKMQPVAVEDMNNDFQVVGLSTSRNKNLLTLLLYPVKEYINAKKTEKNMVYVQVGQIKEHDVLARLSDSLNSDQPINGCLDYLAELRIKIFSQKDLQKYSNFSPLDAFNFGEPATEDQLHKLQLKYHVLTTLNELQLAYLHLSTLIKPTQDELQLLLAMLATTHIRLRLQYLSSLDKLSEFQEQAVNCMLEEAQRLCSGLQKDLTGEEHPLKNTTNHFLHQMERHFQELRKGFANISIKDPEGQQAALLCSISYVEIEPSLENRYCSLCSRQVLMELQDLKQLFDPNLTQLVCPFCHGSYTQELLAAST
ncbi:uncharacterized protein [Drosophila bipectinata]|uniref:uncharacterized protein isoform X1 n=2 Tax=Drosophila bipectinata TaxID=42026 RepID=UPI001C893EC6|nr:uncharacterized protein LOC108124922 [Drosophila bipectinata]